MKHCFSVFTFLLVLSLFSGHLASAAAPEDLVTLSSVASPPVAYSLKRQGNALKLIVVAGAFEPSSKAVAVQAGLSADKTLVLSEKDAQIRLDGNRVRLEFSIPAKKLVDNAEGWKKLRVAIAVEWPGGPLGMPRLKQRFLHRTPAAAHAGLSANPADWQPVDLDELEREAADRARQISFDFLQPMDGKVTVVIENEQGRRVRNLISGLAMAAGSHRVVWDGLDEAGNVALPGRYRWRAISHPGLTPTHLLDFCNAPGSNHGTFQAAATNGKNLYFAAPVSEGGWEIIELSANGEFLRGFNPPNGHGLSRVAVAADEKFLYAAHDGMAWGDHVDHSKPNWKELRTLSVMRINLETGSVAEFPDKVRHAPVRRYEMGPGSAAKMPVEEHALRGMALMDGRLYVADKEAGELLVINPGTGKLERNFSLANPVALASTGTTLFAIADGKLVKVDVASGKTTEIAALGGKPAGLSVGADGRFYVSDAAANVVRVLDAKGAAVGVIGSEGGLKPGKYDPLKFHNPAGLVVLESKVWVTEHNRWQPKRLAAFDAKTGAVTKEYFGPTNYGAQGAGFDDQDQTRWLGQDALWQLDFARGTSRPLSVLGGATGRRHKFWRQDGRTFVLTSGKASYVQELRADGTMRPLACLSSAHQFAYEHDWLPPEEFVAAFKRDYPSVKYDYGKKSGIQRGKPDHGYGMLWVDRNGDGAMQTDEIEFSTAATNLAGSGWSHDQYDLTFRVPGEVGGKKVLVTLKPDGWWPGGAPRYPALNDAVRAAVPIELPGSNQIESAVDRFGNTILNSDPVMRAVSPEGKLLWTYPNQWSGVHGSHRAPLPSTGELQGALFYSGIAPLDDRSDVLLINGNHGRAFVMTSDGLYLDEMFPDVRLMTNPQAGGIGILGGECFGGTFGRSEKDGNYYFQGGGIAYRIYRVDSLRDTKRSEGALTVSAEQSAAAERNQSRRLTAAKIEERETEVAWREKPPVMDGKDDDWPGDPAAQWDRGGKYPVTVRAAHDGKTLYLHYKVGDPSPWVNNGKDWQALFKTGDGVDFQLGADAAANPKRSGPVPGDLRLFLAPMGKETVAVLYRHRVPGAREKDGVVFQSPWRSEKVDVVRQLSSAQIAVQRENNLYRVEAAVPLADLGIANATGLKLRGDFGVIYGDGDGTVNVFRNYWSNQATGLVNDVPGEIMLSPNLWGKITFGEAAAK